VTLLDDDVIARVKERTDLVALIGSFVQLRMSGNNHVGLCPFHAESTPSFTVYDDGHYHCFGCGKHGDAITFVMERDGIGFRAAIDRLASDAPVSIDSARTMPTVTKPTTQKRSGRVMPLAEVHAETARIARNERGGGDWTVRTWAYDNLDGKPALLVARADDRMTPPMEKVMRRLHYVDAGFSWGDPEDAVLLPLYHNEIAAAVPGSYVLLVEGERKCDAVRALGLLCTTIAGGGDGPQNIERASLDVLRPHRVEILGDHDDTGTNRALRIAVKLAADPQRTLPVRVLSFAAVFGVTHPKGADIDDIINELRKRRLEPDEAAEQICIAVENAESLRC
jgi:hypothetical protein